MKRITPTILFAVAMMLSTASLAAEKTVTLTVENMNCASCPFIVKQSLSGVSGVAEVVVSYDDKTAKVTFEDTKANVETLTDATLNAGYPSRLRN
ncbi:mercury resistance system periplasmic binding protein MerP [Magnetovibrio sp. PR-2]|uniref:mercury resistance system periplasmic binding protein MerP n=1 Tax=Magnetovibrio sp. PR-2 TaxID=3120356 RepID=UPI002FCE4230